MKANAVISDDVLVAIEISGAIVGGQQNVQIAVAIKVGVRQAAPDLELRETGVGVRRNVAEFSAAFVQKKLRCLRVAHVAVNVPHRLVDVPVSDEQVQSTIQIHITESPAEAQGVFRWQAYACGDRNIVVYSRAHGPIQSDHLVIKIRDGDS